MTEEEKGELIYLRKKVKELEQQNMQMKMELKEYKEKYYSSRREIYYMRGDDQYDI